MKKIAMVFAVLFVIAACAPATNGAQVPDKLSVSLSTQNTEIDRLVTTSIHADISNAAADPVTYSWFVDDTEMYNQNTSSFDFAQDSAGVYTIKVVVSDTISTATDSIAIEVR